MEPDKKLDPYEVLNVTKKATPEQIQNAFIRLVGTEHPHVSTHVDKYERWKMISDARNALLDHTGTMFLVDSDAQADAAFEHYQRSNADSIDTYVQLIRDGQANQEENLEMTLADILPSHDSAGYFIPVSAAMVVNREVSVTNFSESSFSSSEFTGPFQRKRSSFIEQIRTIASPKPGIRRGN